MKLIEEIVKFYYKRWNPNKYVEFKIEIKNKKILNEYQNNFEAKYQVLQEKLKNKNVINFKHSGHVGDLIYALPIVKELSKTKKCNFYIRVNHSIGKKKYFKHPSGSIMICDRIFNMLVPLLNSQFYINTVQRWENEEIDVDLDLFRDFPFSTNFHSIRWYYHLVGLQPNMNLSFVDVKSNDNFKDKIVVVRTFRGRNPIIDYSFLKKYNNLLFLGVKSEYDDFVTSVPNTEFYDVQDFLEMAEILKGAKFVITNQTFAFALSEGLKVNRLLEANPSLPSVFPIGDNGFDFYFQNQFEELVEKFNG